MLVFQMVIYLRKLTYFSLRKPRIRTFYTASSQNADFIDRHYLVLRKCLQQVRYQAASANAKQLGG